MRPGKTLEMAERVVEELRRGRSVVVAYGRGASDIGSIQPVQAAIWASDLVVTRNRRDLIETEGGGSVRFVFATHENGALRGIRPDVLLEGFPPLAGNAWRDYRIVKETLGILDPEDGR